MQKKKTFTSVAAEDVATADASPELKASIKKRKAEPVMEVPVDAPVDAQSKQKRRKRVRLRLMAYVLSGFEAIYKMKLFFKGRRLLGEQVPDHLL